MPLQVFNKFSVFPPYLEGPFEGWLWRMDEDIQIRIQHIECLCVGVLKDLLGWELETAWRQWKFRMGVHRVEKILRRFRMERMRGATRLWYEGL